MKILNLLGLVFIVQNVHCQCNIQPSIQPGLAPSIPNKFQTRVEVNTEGDNKQVELRYFYDYDRRQAAIETRQNNMNTRLIFNYDTNEIFELKNQIEILSDPLHYPPDGRPEFPTTCTTYTLSNTSSLNYYFGFNQNGEMILPGPAYQIFQFNPLAQGPNDNARGIPCETYTGCGYDPISNSNFTIVHYFSEKTFDIAGGDRVFNRLPIRSVYTKTVTVQGVQKEQKTYMDYHDFKLFVERSSVFQTPSSVFCKNRKATKEVPKFEIAFGFSQEITSNSEIQYIKDFYTFANFSRYEVRNPRKEEATFYTLDPVTYISELTVGIQYGINQAIGNCSVKGIKSDSLYIPKLNQTYNSLFDFLAQIQSTQSFLSFESEFIYTGKRESNGIDADRYITNKSSGIYEYTFSDERFVILNNFESESKVPISLYVDNQRSDLASHSNFFNFETLPPTNILRLFDISSCFNEDDLIQFDIVFPYRGIVQPEDIYSIKQLDIYMYGLLTDLTNEAAIRFKPPTISISNDGNLYVRTSIFPLPPPINFFTLIERKLLLVPAINTYNNINTVEDCARYCFNNEKCLSFDYSVTSKVCHLNNRTVTDGTASTSTSYDHYTKNVPEQRKYLDDLELFNAVNNLAIDKKLLIIIPISENNQVVNKNLYAKETIQRNDRFDRFGTTNLLSRYKLVQPKTKYLSSYQEVEFSSITIDDCARACNEQVGFDCNSFDYCFQTGDCRLRKFAQAENATEVISDENCDIYDKDPLSHYDRFRTKESINPKDLKYIPVKDPSECAKKCDKETKLNCKSFNYCPQNSACYLSKFHLTDSSATLTSNSTCDHYSRKFLSDFTFIGNNQIKLIGEFVSTGASLEACSAQCVASNGLNCKTFDYCQSSKTCILNTGSANVIVNPNVPTELCGHYRRDFFYETSQYFNLKSNGNGKQGLLVGLSVAFGLVSIFAGVIGTIILFRKKNMA